LIFVTLEVGSFIIYHASVEQATEVTSREVYLGRAQTSGMTGSDIENFFCNQTSIIPDCAANTTVELRVIDDFSSFPSDSAQCRDSDVTVNPVITYENGDESDIVFMRVCVRIPVLSSLGSNLMGLSRSETGKYSVITKTAFVNRKFN
jgi:hypothetical protein